MNYSYSFLTLNNHRYGTGEIERYMYRENHDGKGIKSLEVILQKNKITEEPRWCPFHPLVYDMERRLFSGVRTGAENKPICP